MRALPLENVGQPFGVGLEAAEAATASTTKSATEVDAAVLKAANPKVNGGTTEAGLLGTRASAVRVVRATLLHAGERGCALTLLEARVVGVFAVI